MTNSDSSNVLELEDIGRSYGSLAALTGVSFSVARGSRHAVIGPNGAGKSTLFNLIGGVEKPTTGAIRLDARDITRWSPQRRSRAGIAKTFQHSSLFTTLTIEENVSIAVHCHQRSGSRFLRSTHSYANVSERVIESLERVGLKRDRSMRAGDLSHGECRQLELALALCMQPQLLMLDEPVAGMSPAETSGFVDLIESLSKDVTILLVEHDLDVVLRLADTITVLDAGRVIADGPPAQVTSSPAVRSAYLGTALGATHTSGGDPA